MENKLTNINILTIGDRFVGKTSLVKCFAGKKDSPFEYQAYVKKICLDGDTYKLNLRSSKGIRCFFKRTLFLTVRGLVLVFDVTNRQSFDNLRIWLTIIDHLEPNANVFYSHPSEIPAILIGTKCDLQSGRSVKGEEAALFAARNNMTYFETSSVEDINVELAYMTLTATVIQKHTNRCKDSSLNLNDSIPPNNPD